MPRDNELDTQETKPAFWTVAIFMVDRAYGGPEEGGWWYDHGRPIEHIPDGINPHDLMTVFTDEDEATSYRETLQASLDAHINKGRRAISSVLSEGEYRAVVCPGWPAPFPATRPVYE
jgi:hypothetical protein